MIKNAFHYGNVLIMLNSDEWLIRKKGYYMQNWQERKAILEALKGVSHVVPVNDADNTVCTGLSDYRPDMFGNGGDRKPTNTPEVDLCTSLGIECIWNLGNPTTDLLHSSTNTARRTVYRDWGSYEVIFENTWCKVKRIIMKPGGYTSLQRHFTRREFWYSNNKVVTVQQGEWHQLSNPDTKPLEVIEVQHGICNEDDIERLAGSSMRDNSHERN
jgi:D-beta-D-heptose 7-phosphate kinase/D-beta-D-heptose 1-phosphate adenosyltransferase